ncbi:MAG: helix-hairpin-helix domain-containing protein [Fibrobacter sp.]|nr:helix-hairpin-helix domain-containing protein [Fibrobacter sp.]
MYHSKDRTTGPVDLNTADLNSLEKLPMVGDKRAQFIIDHRPYQDWNDLKSKIPGISDGMIEDMKKSKATINNKK